MEKTPTGSPPDARLKGLLDSQRKKPQGKQRSGVSCLDQDLLGGWGAEGRRGRVLSRPDPVQVAARWGKKSAVAAPRLQAEGARSLLASQLFG